MDKLTKNILLALTEAVREICIETQNLSNSEQMIDIRHKLESIKTTIEISDEE